MSKLVVVEAWPLRPDEKARARRELDAQMMRARLARLARLQAERADIEDRIAATVSALNTIKCEEPWRRTLHERINGC